MADAPTATPANINSTIRLFLTAVGPLLIAAGYTDATKWGALSDAILQLVGAAMPLASIIWSYYENHKQTVTLKAAIAAPAVPIEKPADAGKQ